MVGSIYNKVQKKVDSNATVAMNDYESLTCLLKKVKEKNIENKYKNSYKFYFNLIYSNIV